ncbi:MULTISPECIES: hypothetical protein [Roseovarius]|uniref:Anti-sigma factor n=2 Tax=Roseovarius TaxID=74030 RepID=A0ABZ2HJD2_9RHOB|nr:hypothetical protein [Roseovarius sp. W115]MDV2930375.1 hypothetical protein [Roseovarius sp. W115]
MTQKSDFSDDDLTRFIDKEAGKELSGRIKAALKSDANLRQRHDRMVQASVNYKAAMDSMLSLAPAPPEMDIPSREPSRNLRVAVASMAAGALLTWGLTSSFPSSAGSDWKDVVANYQSLYVTETLSLSNVSQTEQNASLVRLSSKLGFNVATLPEIEGLDFVRAQELGFKGRPLAQLTFLTTDMGPVALCIVETGNQTTDRIEFAELHGLDTYSWTQDGFGILLVGPGDETGLEDAAAAFRDAFKAENA